MADNKNFNHENNDNDLYVYTNLDLDNVSSIYNAKEVKVITELDSDSKTILENEIIIRNDFTNENNKNTENNAENNGNKGKNTLTIDIENIKTTVTTDTYTNEGTLTETFKTEGIFDEEGNRTAPTRKTSFTNTAGYDLYETKGNFKESFNQILEDDEETISKSIFREVNSQEVSDFYKNEGTLTEEFTGSKVSTTYGTKENLYIKKIVSFEENPISETYTNEGTLAETFTKEATFDEKGNLITPTRKTFFEDTKAYDFYENAGQLEEKFTQEGDVTTPTRKTFFTNTAGYDFYENAGQLEEKFTQEGAENIPTRKTFFTNTAGFDLYKNVGTLKEDLATRETDVTTDTYINDGTLTEKFTGLTVSTTYGKENHPSIKKIVSFDENPISETYTNEGTLTETFTKEGTLESPTRKTSFTDKDGYDLYETKGNFKEVFTKISLKEEEEIIDGQIYREVNSQEVSDFYKNEGTLTEEFTKEGEFDNPTRKTSFTDTAGYDLYENAGTLDETVVRTIGPNAYELKAASGQDAEASHISIDEIKVKDTLHIGYVESTTAEPKYKVRMFWEENSQTLVFQVD